MGRRDRLEDVAWPYESPRRGAATPERPFGEFDGCIGGWDIEGEPYTPAPGTEFDWWRARMLGGRTNHWGRISLRFGPDDFRRQAAWTGWATTGRSPTTTSSRTTTSSIAWSASSAAVEGARNEPDGVFLPPPKPRCYELLIKQASDQLEDHLHPVAAVDPDAAAQRASGVPLLRPVRPRLRDALELLVPVGAPAAGTRDRQAARSSPARWRGR